MSTRFSSRRRSAPASKRSPSTPVRSAANAHGGGSNGTPSTQIVRSLPWTGSLTPSTRFQASARPSLAARPRPPTASGCGAGSSRPCRRSVRTRAAAASARRSRRSHERRSRPACASTRTLARSGRRSRFRHSPRVQLETDRVVAHARATVAQFDAAAAAARPLVRRPAARSHTAQKDWRAGPTRTVAAHTISSGPNTPT